MRQPTVMHLLALLVYPLLEALEAETPQPCMISSYGWDGFGHRVAAGVSCVVVAHELGLQYVHRPWTTLEHISADEVPHLQAFLGFYDWSPRMQPHMKERTRYLPYVGNCTDHGGWLDAVAATDPANRTGLCDRHTVYQGDNCWDRFFCTTMYKPVHRQVCLGTVAAFRHRGTHGGLVDVEAIRQGTHQPSATVR